MKSFGPRIVLASVGIMCVTAATAQYWEEDFSHNNAGLYTNLNGGPDNLTIEEGMARFGGVEGTYYGRTDLLIPSFQTLVYSYGFTISQACGPIGFGWYSPVQNAGMSVLVDRETLTFSLIEHQGFENPTVLESVAYQVPLWFPSFGNWEPIPAIGFHWEEDFGWVAFLFGGDPPQFYGTQYYAGVTPTEDMHFFMYGWESSVFGPGILDGFWTSSVPEPSAIAVMVIALGYVAVRRRSRMRSAD